MTTTTTKRRRVMRSFKILELSAVDRPAQAGATVAIMKRADGDDHEQENDMEIRKIGGDEVASFNSLEEAMRHIRKARGVSASDAMSAAAREHPGLLKRYQSEGAERVAKAAEAAKARSTSPEVRDFEFLVAGIAERDGVTRSEAMTRARRENPGAYRAYCAA